MPKGSSCARILLLGVSLVPAYLSFTPAVFAIDPAKKITQYIHDVWTTEQGLPENDVRSVVQTRDGYLWLATEEGLVRFDGVYFKVFDKTNTEAINNNYIKCLFEDSQGILWVGTLGGLGRFREGKFESYTEKDGLANRIVNVITQDSNGNIWIGTNGGGLNLWRDGKFTVYTTKDGLSHDVVLALYPGRDGTLWIGTARGLDHLDHGRITHPAQPKELTSAGAIALYEDPNRVLWIGSSRGLYSQRGGVFTLVSAIPRSAVGAIYRDRDGTLYVGTERGLYRLRQNRAESYSVSDGLIGRAVNSIVEDREGSLWIATFGGLNRLRDGKFTVYTTQDGLADNGTSTILQGRNGEIWIGTFGGGLSKFSNGRFETIGQSGGLVSDYIQAMGEAHDGGLWIGTLGGLNHLNDGTITLFGKRHGIPQTAITAVFDDKRRGLWIGTRIGLYRLQNGNVTTFTASEGLSNNEISCIFESSDGNLWVGTFAGLNLFRDGRFVDFPERQALATDFVTQVGEEPAGTLWISTQTSGIKRIRDGKVIAIGSKDGLPLDTVWTTLFDSSGYVWISSDKGIFRIPVAEIEDFGAGKIHSVHPVIYNTADGMKSSECNGGKPAGWRTSDGKLWFPTTQGVAVIDPKNIRVNVLPPPVYIDEVLMKGERVAREQAAHLAAGSRDLEFHYTALSLLVPDRVRFKYKLEGYDRNWVDAGARRTAYYSSLPPGQYTFRVIAANNDGVWNDAGAAYSFTLKPRFYQTFWFYLPSALAVGLLVWGIYQRNMLRLQRRSRELAVVNTGLEDKLRMEEQLRQSLADKLQAEGRYRDLFESAVYAMYRAQNGRYLEVNRAMVSMLGYGSVDEVIVLDPATQVYSNSADLQRVIAELDAAGRMEGFETVWKRKDGRHILVRLSGRRTATPPGVPDTFEMIAQDITEHKQLEEQLRQSQKMEAIGQLAGGIAHDFNNLLTVILGYTRLALDDERNGYSSELQHVVAAADQGAALTGQLLAFSRQQVLQPQVLNLNNTVSKMQAMLGRVIGEDIELTTDLDPELNSVRADPNQVAQVMMNLAINARDAMPRGGRLHFATRNVAVGENSHATATVLEGQYVLLEVSDTGQGMDEATMSHIFEPFFTTKDPGRGTGLGLATVYGIVKQSAGYIDAESQPGQGTTFRIYLPEVPEAEGTLAVMTDRSGAAGGNETILLIEDHAGLRELMARILQANGYTVLQAGVPAEAERICREHAGPLHMILSDVVMPGTTGPELVQRLLRQRPGTKVMYVSGYMENAALREEVLNHNLPFLQKPYGPVELLRRVREVLDAPVARVRRPA